MSKTFEETLKELETVVINLEKGDLSLDEAIKNFEKGMALSKECNERLDEAEKKINILVKKDNEIVEENFVSQD